MILACLACALQFVELGTRWNMTGVWPLTNLYGSLSLFSGLGVLIYIIFASKYDLWLIGGGVLGISAIAFGYATTWNEGYMPAVPALQSYWIKVHVPIVVSSYASFMVAFVVSCLYLFKSNSERRFSTGSRVVRASAAGTGGTVAMSVAAPPPTMEAHAARTETPGIAAAASAGDPFALWLAGLPSLARLDMLTYRIIAIGLVAAQRRHHHRRDVGQRSVGRVLAVGSQRNRRAALVDHLRLVHALAHAQRVARRTRTPGSASSASPRSCSAIWA